MAPAPRRLRPPANSSGSCSPGGRLLALRMRGGQRVPSLPSKSMLLAVRRRLGLPWLSAVDGCRPLPGHFYLLKFHSKSAPVPSRFLPPGSTVPRLCTGRRKPNALPLRPWVLPRTLEAAVSQHHWVPLRAAPLRPHLSLHTPVPRLKGPGASPAAGEGGILGGSVRPPSKRGQVFLPSPCWG